MFSKYSLALLVVGAAIAQADITRVFSKTYTPAEAASVALTTMGGEIRVKTGNYNAVTVEIYETIKVETEAEAKDVRKDMELAFDQSGSQLAVTAKSRRGNPAWMAPNPRVKLRIEAKVPMATNLSCVASGGDIGVDDLDGTLQAKTSGGDIWLGRMKGKAEVATSGGDIEIVSAAQRLRASTSGGDIMVEELASEADLSTSGGFIMVYAAQGPLKAHTSGGDVDVAVPVTGTLASMDLSTSGGSVKVKVARSASFFADLKTSGGRALVDHLVKTDGNIGQANRSEVRGQVGASGGPTLKLRSSGGSVRVQAL